ncbi:adenosylmethionine--8-amino-7-oxononanoate aminotransferase BioA, partial [Burkholderia cenocepacia]|nr:adenosylmethionine--8-amino-7-oxononanoate aminotransferase BioA [Burkholderia cenocepacia]
DLFARDDVLVRNAGKSATLRAALAPLDGHPQVRHLRERGTLFAFDVALDGDTARGFSRRFFEHALARELLLRPIGTTVYLMPPYVM